MDSLPRLAQTYHASIQALSDAEAKHRVTIDQLATVESSRLPEKINLASDAVKTSEIELQQALHAATVNHREYWNARRMALLPGLYQAAEVFRRYRHVAFSAGVANGDTAWEDALAAVQSPDITDGVPVEGPDSDSLA